LPALGLIDEQRVRGQAFARRGDGILEAFMRAGEPGEKLRELFFPEFFS